MTGLTTNTIYYIRAYATNETATTYGTEETYTIGTWVTSGGNVVTSGGNVVNSNP
jgi:hypothetical protein